MTADFDLRSNIKAMNLKQTFYAVFAAGLILLSGCVKEDNKMKTDVISSTNEKTAVTVLTEEKEKSDEPKKISLQFGELFQSDGARGVYERLDGAIICTKVEKDESAGVKRIVCLESKNPNARGSAIGTVAEESYDADFGDCSMLVSSDGLIYCSFRVNKYNYPSKGNSLHEIRISVSSDGGKTWSSLPPVASHTAHMTGYNENEIRGLWSQYLFETSEGEIQCYYDDENVCWKAGHQGHQWWMMKTLDKQSNEWSEAVTVSRTIGNLIARDGMGAVVETSGGTLVAVFESVRTTAPYRGCIRVVTSDDHGKTWSFSGKNGSDTRKILYAPKDKNFSALQPWITLLPNDVLLCSFITDEDNRTPDEVSTGSLHQSVKYMLSYDIGKTWEGPYTIDPDPVMKSPAIVYLKYGRFKGMLLYQARYGTSTIRRFVEITETN